MRNFIGTFECKIDDKGRVKIPALLAKQMENFGDETFVVKRSVFQSSLEVYPLSRWDFLMEKVNKLNRFVKKNADFIRIFTAGVKTVELDKAGRIQISKDLTSFANLTKEIVLTSAGDFFEIWDKEAYEKVISADLDNFAALAEEVMGDQFNIEL
jgi:MraZ protein